MLSLLDSIFFHGFSQLCLDNFCSVLDLLLCVCLPREVASSVLIFQSIFCRKPKHEI